MKGALGIRKPIGSTGVLDSSVTNIPISGTYAQLIASTPYNADALVCSNGGSQPLAIGLGAAGVEKPTGIIIPPGHTGQLFFPMPIPKGSRVSVLATLAAAQTSGIVTVALFD